MRHQATRLRILLTASVLVVGAVATPSAAQTANGPPNTAAAMERMQSHSAHHLSTAVSGQVGQRLRWPGQNGELGQMSAPVVSQDEGGASGAAGSDTETPLSSVWIGPNVTWSDQEGPINGNKGYTITTHLGLDWSVGGRGVLGILAGFEGSDYDTATLAGNLNTDGRGIGVYGGYALTDRIIIDASALYTWIGNDYADLARAASYDSGRLQLAANLTGYLTRGQFNIRPKLGVSYTLENQDAYTDTAGFVSPEIDTETFSASLGAQVGYTYVSQGERTIEPYLGAVVVVEDSSTDSPRVGRELDEVDISLSAGLNAQLAEGVSLQVNADASGLARSGYEAMTVGGQLSYEF